MGGILNHTDGYGFKMVFQTSEEAQHYKEMFTWIIKSDKYKITNKKGYYDVL